MPESFVFICMSIGELENALENDLDDRTASLLADAYDAAGACHYSIHEVGNIRIYMRKIGERRADESR